MGKKLSTIHTGDQNLQAVQSNVKSAIDDITALPELNANYILVVLPSTAGIDFTVNHGLGRECQYYMIVKADSDVRVYTSSTTNTALKKQLILKASGTGNITLKVY